MIVVQMMEEEEAPSEGEEDQIATGDLHWLLSPGRTKERSEVINSTEKLRGTKFALFFETGRG